MNDPRPAPPGPTPLKYIEEDGFTPVSMLALGVFLVGLFFAVTSLVGCAPLPQPQPFEDFDPYLTVPATRPASEPAMNDLVIETDAQETECIALMLDAMRAGATPEEALQRAQSVLELVWQHRTAHADTSP